MKNLTLLRVQRRETPLYRHDNILVTRIGNELDMNPPRSHSTIRENVMASFKTYTVADRFDVKGRARYLFQLFNISDISS